MFGIGKRLALIHEIDAKTQANRRAAYRGCDRYTRETERLADTLNPDRVTLREAKIDTSLPNTF